ncbi:hypothetical protein [Empedobacter brevis]|uniref:hypothetical protein n=1 Tax=Empedobacter brevis TaxID=247 RepID=UPI00289DFA98|nr:hypothetical protein [Empedobacter brevis]
MRKLIVIPKNKAAERDLAFDKASSEELIEIQLDQVEFDSLWKDGIFLLINMVCDTNIDDFEDEHIYDLNLIQKTYDKIKMKYPNQKIIIKAFHFALIYKTSIHFYF